MKNIIQWMLPDLIFITHARKGEEKFGIKALRSMVDQGLSFIKIKKEDVETYLCFKKRIEKMEDKKFLQCLCNTGVKLNEDGKTVKELKLMVNKAELAIV